MKRGPVDTRIVAVVAALAYVALDAVSYIHPTEHYGITPWNPQPSVAIALLVLAGVLVTGLLYVSAIHASGLAVAGGFVDAWMRFWVGMRWASWSRRPRS